MEADETCKTCRFWSRNYYAEASGKYEGDCLRFPPKVISELLHDSAFGSAFPVTVESSWCGEYDCDQEKAT